MPSDRSLQWLDDIRDNILLAQSFVQDHDQESFEADRRTFYAAVRCLEIISEASRRLPDELKARYPHIDWPRMAAAGNAYRHGYGNLVPERIWDTLRDARPPLLNVVERELTHLS